MEKEKTKLENAQENMQKAKEKLLQKTQEVNEFVKENPYKAIGIATLMSAGAGFVAGLLLGRLKK